MCEEQLGRHYHSTNIMKDIDVNVFLRKYAQEREVIRVKDVNKQHKFYF